MLNFESIKSKATKLYNLTKSSNDNEASNAKNKLELLLMKYNLAIEDVVVDSITELKYFKVETLDHFEVLTQVAMKSLNTDRPSEYGLVYDRTSYSASMKLTEIEYIYVNMYYDFYINLFMEDYFNFVMYIKNEVTAIRLNISHFKMAFFMKHKLFNNKPKIEETEPVETPFSELEIHAIHYIASCIQDSDNFHPHKMLS